ncbi:SGNH/GDSL hydrolase family protein [Paenibacillus sp. Marseille-Q7038]
MKPMVRQHHAIRIKFLSLRKESTIDFESQAYRNMIDKSLLSKGNTYRLKKAIDKAKRGEPVTVAFIGGSITHGAGAEPLHLNCYVYQTYDLFKRMFAREDGSFIRLIKAGVGGTPSELGIVRYDRDVLRDGTAETDIVIVEFAVNDLDDETKGNCYESLVLKALGAENKPAVILLFSVFESDWNLQDRLAPVGWHYHLPMVSVKDAVVDQFQWTEEQGKVISKKQFFHDIYHPTNAGHKIMSDCLGKLFEEVDRSAPDKDDYTNEKLPLIGNDFVDIKLLDRLNGDLIAVIDEGGFQEMDTDLQQAEMDDHSFSTLQFPNNWMHGGQADKHYFKMTIRSKRLIMIFKDTGSADFGSASIWVNGKRVRTADPHKVNWTRCNAILLYDEQDTGEHTVEIRMDDKQENKRFTILGFGYVS